MLIVGISTTFMQVCLIVAREHEGTERDTEGVSCDMSVTKVIFSFRKSVFRDVRTEYNLDQRFLVKFNDNGGFVEGTHKHFSWGYKRSLFKAICSFKETIFIKHCCIRGIAEYLFKNCPQPLYDNYKLYNYYLLNKV